MYWQAGIENSLLFNISLPYTTNLNNHLMCFITIKAQICHMHIFLTKAIGESTCPAAMK
jgi:hypothetical protein